MNGLVALPLAVVVIAALVASPRFTALRPASAARSDTALLTAVIVPTLPTLWLLGLGGLARLGLRTPFFDWCRHLLPDGSWLGATVGVAALTWATIATARLARIVIRHRRLRVVGDSRYTVVDSGTSFAYALPGPGGAVVVSSALRDSLTADEFDLVLAHEEAHVRERHDRHLLVALTARAVVPAVAPITRRMEHHIERWADEEALDRTGVTRRLAARTVAKVALASTPTVALGFGSTGTAARAEALLDPPRAPSRHRRVEAAVLVGAVAALALVQVHRTGSFALALLG